MAVPKHKTSKARRDSRKANFKASATSIIECPQCHASIPNHTICKECGYYKGVKRIETKKDKKEAK